MPELKRVHSSSERALIACFSYSGNTRQLARQIKALVGGEILEILPVEAYPVDYDAVVAQSRRELKSGYLPALKSTIDNLDSYDVLFLGYPNWCGTIPRPVATLLTGCDLAGKAIVPFCTHEGSGLGNSVRDIAMLCPHSTIMDGLAVRGTNAADAQSVIMAWLESLRWQQTIGG
jgi:flavodoxin